MYLIKFIEMTKDKSFFYILKTIIQKTVEIVAN